MIPPDPLTCTLRPIINPKTTEPLKSQITYDLINGLFFRFSGGIGEIEFSLSSQIYHNIYTLYDHVIKIHFSG